MSPSCVVNSFRYVSLQRAIVYSYSLLVSANLFHFVCLHKNWRVKALTRQLDMVQCFSSDVTSTMTVYLTVLQRS